MAHHQPIAAPPETTVVLDGLNFPEGARTGPDASLYVSDVYAHRVLRVDRSTWTAETIALVPGQPSGLGFLPDGRLLVVSMRDLRLYRLEPSGELVLHADLSQVTVGAINDMLVDAGGRAWVGDFGFDYYGLLDRDPDADPLFGPDADPPTARVTRVDPDGTVTTVAADLRFPNGIVQLDGTTLVVAETVGACLTAFDITPDGTLENRRVWADLSTVGVGGSAILPDGLSLGGDMTVWVADPGHGGAARIAAGGRVVQRVQGTQPAFCVLAMADHGYLLCGTAETSNSIYATEHTTGRLEVAAIR